MAYSVQADWERAAGGRDRLVELTDLGNTGRLDLDILEKHSEEVDGSIDGKLTRIQSLPFNPVPPRIRGLAAHGIIYRLKCARETASQEDHERHRERLAELDGMAAGKENPRGSSDPYPIGEDSSTPKAAERATEDDDFGRAALARGGF